MRQYVPKIVRLKVDFPDAGGPTITTSSCVVSAGVMDSGDGKAWNINNKVVTHRSEYHISEGESRLPESGVAVQRVRALQEIYFRSIKLIHYNNIT